MGGAFLLARQIFTSDIWKDKPATWKIIWVYILGTVNHKDNGKFKRGEGFFMLKKDLDNIGYDITIDMVKKCMQWLRDSEMIRTKRSTRGVIIKVLNYNKYQTLDNYQSTDKSTTKVLEKHQRSTTINKNDKNDKNEKYIAEASSAFDFSSKLKLMTNDPNKAMNIISAYWVYKEIRFENEEQYRAGIKENSALLIILEGIR